jgi:hypothetical protein
VVNGLGREVLAKVARVIALASFAGVAVAGAGCAPPAAGAGDAAASTPDAGPPAPLTPPPASPDLRFDRCGVMNPRPDVIGVDGDGEVVLLARSVWFAERKSSIHLFSTRTGRVTRSISLGTDVAVLTADRHHVLTATDLVDLATGDAKHLATPLDPSPAGDVKVLAVGPAGDFAVVADTGPAATRIVVRGLIDGAEREVATLAAGPQVTAAAVSDDGRRFHLFVREETPPGSRTWRFTLETRAVSNGDLEREILLADAVALKPFIEGTVVWNPRLATTGDYVLASVPGVGFVAHRISDGQRVWTAAPDVFTEAYLSPRAGVVLFASDAMGPWTERDMEAGRDIGTFPGTWMEGVKELGVLTMWGYPALWPDGTHTVLPLEWSLELGHEDGTSEPLPFRGSWGWGRRVFVAEDQVVTVETDPKVRLVVRKRAIPGGEILMETHAPGFQSTWTGDAALSPDGRQLAIAAVDRVQILRTADLGLVAELPTIAGRMFWAPDGKALAVTPAVQSHLGSTPTVVHDALDIWGVDGRVERSIALPFVPVFAVFSADGRSILTSGRTGMAFNDPLTDGKTFEERVLLSGAVQGAWIDRATGATRALASAPLAVDPEGHFADDLTSIVRLADGAPIAALDLPVGVPPLPEDQEPHVAGVWLASSAQSPPEFSPDGALVSGIANAVDGGNEVILYASATGRRVQTFPVSEANAATLTFSPSGRVLTIESPGGLELYCRAP